MMTVVVAWWASLSKYTSTTLLLFVMVVEELLILGMLHAGVCLLPSEEDNNRWFPSPFLSSPRGHVFLQHSNV